MELSYLLVVAALSALLAGALNTALAPVFARLRGKSVKAIHEQTFAAQLASLGVYVCAGLGFGMLFWLSWGLAAVVGVSWWWRGLLFALVTWSMSCLPLLAVQLLAFRTHWSVALIAASEWLIASSIVGLACGWAWSKGP